MKKCPNCGAMMATDVNFCTNCGADIRQVSITEENNAASVKEENQVKPQVSQQVEPKSSQAQSAQTISSHQMANYWSWLVSSWKKPMQEVDHEKWFGVVTLAAEIIIFTLGFWRMVQNGVSMATNAAGSAASSLIGSEISKGISNFASQQVGKISGYLFLALIIGTVAMIGLSIAGYNVVYKKQVNVMEYTTRLAQYSNYNLIIGVVVLLFALVGINQLIVILALAMLLIFTVAILVPVLADGKGQGDKVLGGLLAIAGLLLAIIIFSFLFRSAVQSIIGSFSSNLGSLFE